MRFDGLAAGDPNLDSSFAWGRVTPRPSSPALLPQGEGRKLPLPGGEGWGEGEPLLCRGFARDFESATEELRLNGALDESRAAF